MRVVNNCRFCEDTCFKSIIRFLLYVAKIIKCLSTFQLAVKRMEVLNDLLPKPLNAIYKGAINLKPNSFSYICFFLVDQSISLS